MLRVAAILIQACAADHRGFPPLFFNAIARARGWYGQIESGGTGSMAAIARHEGLAARYVSRLLRCAFLAPDIIESLLAGSAPPEMTLAKVLEGVPLDWAEQRQRFGFSSIKNAAH